MPNLSKQGLVKAAPDCRIAISGISQSRINSDGTITYVCKIGRERVMNYTYNATDRVGRPKQIEVREYLPKEELLKQDFIKSCNGRPFVVLHPESRLLKGNQIKNSISGVLYDVTKKESTGELYGNLRVWDENANKDIQSGVKELSLGYQLKPDYTPGTFDNEPYDLIQRNLKLNHIALVPTGRNGKDVRILFKGDISNMNFDDTSRLNSSDEEGVVSIAVLNDRQRQAESRLNEQDAKYDDVVKNMSDMHEKLDRVTNMLEGAGMSAQAKRKDGDDNVKNTIDGDTTSYDDGVVKNMGHDKDHPDEAKNMGHDKEKLEERVNTMQAKVMDIQKGITSQLAEYTSACQAAQGLTGGRVSITGDAHEVRLNALELAGSYPKEFIEARKDDKDGIKALFDLAASKQKELRLNHASSAISPYGIGLGHQSKEPNMVPVDIAI